jgi:hypothetical protein
MYGVISHISISHGVIRLTQTWNEALQLQPALVFKEERVCASLRNHRALKTEFVQSNKTVWKTQCGLLAFRISHSLSWLRSLSHLFINLISSPTPLSSLRLSPFPIGNCKKSWLLPRFKTEAELSTTTFWMEGGKSLLLSWYCVQEGRCYNTDTYRPISFFYVLRVHRLLNILKHTGYYTDFPSTSIHIIFFLTIHIKIIKSSLLLHGAFWSFTQYYTPINSLIIYIIY